MTFRLVLFLVLLLNTPLLAQSDPEALFKKANQAMKAEDYQQALDGYRQLLAIERRGSVLWNAGMAAYFLNLPKEAKGYWKELKAANPGDFAVRAKLVQVYQQLGDTVARDAERVALKNLRAKAPKNSDLGKEKAFCRDQFMAAGHRVLAMEQYAFDDPNPILYVFFSPDDPAQKGKWLSLGSYKAINDFTREAGKIGPHERVFHLDGYDQNSQHWTYDFYIGEPGYEAIKDAVIGILEGRAKPLSGTKTEGKPPIDAPTP